MFRLPFSFIITGLAGFILFQFSTLLDLGSWVHLIGTVPRNPSGWFHAHLLVLGWGTMIAMGAVYQLINVILQSNIYSEKLGFVHYGFFTVGATGLIFGFKTMNIVVIAGFATLAFIGIVLFAWNMGATLIRANKWNPITLSTAYAIAYLVLTGVTGMLMGINFYFQQWGELHERLFGAHIWFGAVGWFGLLISGFSYKMLPMFYLSHGYSEKMQNWILLIWNVGVIAGASVYLFGGNAYFKWMALMITVLAFVLYCLHLRTIYAHRHKPEPGSGIKWSIGAAFAMGVVGILALFFILIFPQSLEHTQLIVMVGSLYLWGWVAITILGYLSKIVPFLWWTQKYSQQIGKKKIPTMADLMSERWVHWGLCLIAVSLYVVLIGIGLNSAWIAAIGACFLSIGSLGYAGLIALVFTK